MKTESVKKSVNKFVIVCFILEMANISLVLIAFNYFFGKPDSKTVILCAGLLILSKLYRYIVKVFFKNN